MNTTSSERLSITMKNSVTNSLLALAVGGLMIAGFASAQTPTAPAPTPAPAASGAGPGQVDPGHPRVNQVNARETRQQQRIANGVKNGTLTPRQTSNIERREANVQKSEQHDMSKNGGHLTKPEQNRLNQRENHISKTIKDDKHSSK
jgi:uncharacterized lipoprotein YajG